MKIYTKTGDEGTTGLLGGRRVRKDELRLEAVGTADELNAALGLAVALGGPVRALEQAGTLGPAGARAELLQRLQAELFSLGAELAATPDALERLSSSGAVRLLGQADVAALEKEIDALEARLPPLRHFLLPGGNSEAAALHLARTVARRAERVIVSLAAHEAGSVRQEILQYVNRLSDLLFVLARAANHDANTAETAWTPPKINQRSQEVAMNSTAMTRPEALALLTEYTTNPSLIKHALAVETAMRAYARRFGEDEERWGIAGLLHDFDYEKWPNIPDHGTRGAEILAAKGYPQDVIKAIQGHATYLGVERDTMMAKALYAVDELTGFITAVALVRPNKDVRGVGVASVKKKFKDKAFARGVNREDIFQGAEELGVELDDHIAFVIEAMASIAGELGL